MKASTFLCNGDAGVYSGFYAGKYSHGCVLLSKGCMF